MPNESACQAVVRALTALVLSLGSTMFSWGSESPWFARSWDAEEGLPNNTIAGIAQTADGYLWLGTPSGLVRFDGTKFEDVSPTNFIAPPNRGTIAMLHDSDDALWLAMDRGAVVRLHAGAAQVFTEDLPNKIPNGLARDAQGGVWVAYRSGIVYRIKGGKVSECTTNDGLPSGSDICALASDKSGRIWFAKGGHVGIVRNGRFNIIRRLEPLPARLASARTGGVWLCLGFRLYRIAELGQFQELGAFRPERGGTVATVMIEDHEGAVWIGTSFSGLFRYDEAGFEAIHTTHQEILSLAEDREGSLWAGTAGGGLNCIRRRGVTLEGPEQGLPFPAVQSICQDAGGTLWAATQNGRLARRTGGKWISLEATNHWPVDATCLTTDAQGRL